MPQVNALSEIKRKIKAGEVPIGTFITSLDPATTTIMGSVGFDFLIIDCEHGPIDRAQALQHVRAAQATGTIALARVLENSPALIQSFLDIGVQGVVVPHVDDAEGARRMVKASQYAPGGRGMCPICHAGKYSVDGWSDHVRHSNANILAIPLLESRAAVENIAEIAAVDGLEMVMFGPGDLSQDMGLSFPDDNERLRDTWNHVRDTVHAAGKLILVPHGFGFEGADILVNDMDLKMLRETAKKVIAAHKGSGEPT
ncbi:aldolase/citrate lyase family protein [Sphingomonadaceae bacterium G21617-S1]|nr:aldolase/citrate lyase family protein [Sphingomonadaceae bacterium G21617-S1]